MHLTSFILLGCALACPLGMGLMMWLMGKGRGGIRHGRRSSSKREDPDG